MSCRRQHRYCSVRSPTRCDTNPARRLLARQANPRRTQRLELTLRVPAVGPVPDQQRRRPRCDKLEGLAVALLDARIGPARAANWRGAPSAGYNRALMTPTGTADDLRRDTLVMTATFRPPSTPYLVVRDEGTRIQQYMCALVSWARTRRVRRIILGENSNTRFDFSRIVGYLEARARRSNCSSSTATRSRHGLARGSERVRSWNTSIPTDGCFA